MQTEMKSYEQLQDEAIEMAKKIISIEKESESLKTTIEQQKSVIKELKAKLEKAEDDFVILVEKVLEKI